MIKVKTPRPLGSRALTRRVAGWNGAYRLSIAILPDPKVAVLGDVLSEGIGKPVDVASVQVSLEDFSTAKRQSSERRIGERYLGDPVWIGGAVFEQRPSDNIDALLRELLGLLLDTRFG